MKSPLTYCDILKILTGNFLLKIFQWFSLYYFEKSVLLLLTQLLVKGTDQFSATITF